MPYSSEFAYLLFGLMSASSFYTKYLELSSFPLSELSFLSERKDASKFYLFFLLALSDLIIDMFFLLGTLSWLLQYKSQNA